jgi:VHL beta domain
MRILALFLGIQFAWVGEALAQSCSTESTIQVEIAVINRRKEPVDIYWIDYNCREVPKRTLKAGARWNQRTYVSHPWRIRDPGTGQILKEFVTNPATPVITFVD